MGYMNEKGRQGVTKPAIQFLAGTYNSASNDPKEAIIGCYGTNEKIMKAVKEAEKGAYEKVSEVKVMDGLEFNPNQIEHLVMRNEVYEVKTREEEERN